MINNISWQSYWVTLALISTGYYLIIYLLYFRNDFKILFHRKPPEAIALVRPSPPPEESSARLIESCMDEINAFFEQARRNKCVKEELIYSLQVLLKKYPSLKNSEYKESLSNVIVAQCEHICSVHVSEDEAKHMWLG